MRPSRASLRIAILLALIMSALLEEGLEITPAKLAVGFALSLVVAWGTIQFLFSSIGSEFLWRLLAFAVWAALDFLIAIANDVNALWWFRRFFPILTLTLMVPPALVALRTLPEIRTAYTTLIVVGTSMILQAAVRVWGLHSTTLTDVYELRRYGGGYYSAFTLSLALPVVLFAKRSHRAERLIGLSGLIVSAVGLILSLTRTYWISTLAAITFIAALVGSTQPRLALRSLIRATAALGVTLTVLVLVAPSNVGELALTRVVSIFAATNVNDLSFYDRITELRGLWDSSVRNPLGMIVGNGLGAKFSFHNIDPFLWTGETGTIQNDYSHNYYAFIFWTMGVVGLLIFLSFWSALLKRAVRFVRESARTPLMNSQYVVGISAALINLLVCSLTGPPLMSFKWGVYVAVLTAMALNLTKPLENPVMKAERKAPTHSLGTELGRE